METQTKLRKKSFTIVEQAIHQVRGFRNLYQELDDKVRLSGQSSSTLNNYARKLAQLSLHFGKLPQHISEKELNKYLAGLARQSKAPSLSDFKFAVYGLRYCYRLLGMNDKIVQLPSIKRDNKLPVVLNYEECKALFNAPELLKHRVLLSLMYSAGLRAHEASRLRIADIDSGRMMIHIRQSKYNKDRYVPLSPNGYVKRTLSALLRCRTSSLGGHIDFCDACGEQRISYNSCGNRHCPKCQGAKQALWVEDRMNDALDVRYFHIVFTIPEELNQICLLGSNLFYKTLFECVWSVLQQFGYTRYGVESGAICVLHTWGQNLSLHPHIHCIVPSAGLTLAGNLKRITKNGKYLYPVLMLSPTFRSILLKKLKYQLTLSNQLPKYQSLIDEVWKKPWVVYCKPPFGNAQQIVKYLGQYSHRVAISNHRILNIDDSGVTFFYKDYKDDSRIKPTTLSGVEFLRRFCLHILPKRFVKIRYYGILSTKQKDRAKSLLAKKPEITVKETRQERIVRLTGFDSRLCPVCKTGFMHTIELLPKIRAPTNVLYATKILSC